MSPDIRRVGPDQRRRAFDGSKLVDLSAFGRANRPFFGIVDDLHHREEGAPHLRADDGVAGRELDRLGAVGVLQPACPAKSARPSTRKYSSWLNKPQPNVELLGLHRVAAIEVRLAFDLFADPAVVQGPSGRLSSRWTTSPASMSTTNFTASSPTSVPPAASIAKSPARRQSLGAATR